MKTFRLTTMIFVFLLFCSSGIQAQTKQAKLNQIELVKQWVGSWTGELAKDTTLNWDIKSCGTGLECHYKYISKEKVVMEGEQLWGYDKNSDKYLVANMVNGIDIGIYACWFISSTKYKFIPYSELFNPDKASINKYNGEFKSPDVYEETYIVNNKPVRTYSFTRVKK
jgi:hypothetical protein